MFVCSLTGAIRRNSILGNVTDADIQKEIVRCLYGALDREGGQHARMRKEPATVSGGVTATNYKAGIRTISCRI